MAALQGRVRRLPSLHFRCLSHDALQRPSLRAAERPRFDDGDGIAWLRFVVLVMYGELRCSSLGLSVQPMADLPLDGNDDALLHLVADDHANLFRLSSHS